MDQGIHEWNKYNLWKTAFKKANHHFKFLKGCLPQILFGPFFNTLTHLLVSSEIFALKTLTTVFCNSKVIFGYFKGDLRPKLHACIYDILLILCMEKETCTKFCGVLISINKVIKLQSFAVDASDVIPANVQNI